MRYLILPLLLSAIPLAWADKPAYPELNENYQPPEGWQSQCLGRMQFDLPREISWYVAATSHKSNSRSQGDTWGFEYGRDSLHSEKYLVTIKVSVPITLDEWKSEKTFFRPDKAGAQQRVIQKKINDMEPRLDQLAVDFPDDYRNPAYLATHKQLRDEQRTLEEQLKRVRKVSTDIVFVGELIERFKKEGRPVDHLEAELKELLAEDASYPTDELFEQEHMLDLGIPNALAVSWHDGVTATIWQKGRSYHFKFGQQHGKPASTQETLEPAALDLLSRFRAREEHEIPNEPGVCLPYGFIADNGQEPFQFVQTWRPTDNGDVVFRFDQPASNEVATSLLKRLVAGNPFPSRLRVNNFGPRDVPFAGREGSIVGARYQARNPDNPDLLPPETYRMIADVSATENLPSVSLKLETAQVEGIPAFEQAEAEFKQILQSFRPLPGIAAQIKAASKQ